MFITKTINKPIVSLKDIADVCNMSTGGISNWLSRDDDFPTPYARTSAGPIWKAEEIAAYLQKRRNINVVANAKFLYKRIAVHGEAGAGKSFFISRFVSDKKAYRNLFCGSGKTLCPIITRVSEEFSEGYTFHTSFLEDFQEEINYRGHSDLAVSAWAAASMVEELLNGNPYTMDNKDALENIRYAVESIYDTLDCEERACAQSQNAAKARKCTAYIEVRQRPSDFCRELLRSCGLGFIELIETGDEHGYGHIGYYKSSEIFKSDIYTFIAREENFSGLKSVGSDFDSIKHDVADSKIMYLYRYDNIIDTSEEYSEATDEARAFMDRRFSKHEIVKSAISGDLDMFARPSERCFVFPPMKPYKSSFAERMFLADVKVKLLEAFAADDGIDEEFSALLKEHGDKVKELVLKLMRGIKAHNFFSPKQEDEYTISDFLAEEHDREKSKDEYRVTRALERAYFKETQLLYYYFTDLTKKDYPEDWQQAVIRYVYAKLSQGVRKDRGLGAGTYGGEEYPPKTMLVEESLLAGIVLSQLDVYEDRFTSDAYCKALKKGGVVSDTWDYVECIDADGDMQLKLRIVKRCFIDKDVKAYSLAELVLYRYIGSLRKLAQYDILRKMGYGTDKGNDECMALVEEFPF